MSDAGYIVTASGVSVGGQHGTPTIADIALGLSRQPRFGGHTRQPWTVLDHSVFCFHLALRWGEDMRLDRKQRRGLALAALLHDAHEAITGDVPTPFKSPALRLLQEQLDRRIMGAYLPGGYVTYLCFLREVKEIDRMALLAEAREVGPVAFATEAGMKEHFGEDAGFFTWRKLVDLLTHRPVTPDDFVSLYDALHLGTTPLEQSA